MDNALELHGLTPELFKQLRAWAEWQPIEQGVVMPKGKMVFVTRPADVQFGITVVTSQN